MISLHEIIYNHLYDGLAKNGNRTTGRTKRLHNSILELIKSQIPNFDNRYTVFHEENIPCAYGNDFKIDILIKDKDEKIVCCILLKAFISSVQKNRANNANTTIGEIFRIKGVHGREDMKVWFISLMANNIPNYKSDGKLRSMEKFESSHVDLTKIHTKENVYHSTIRYDIDDIDYSTKLNFKDTLKLENIKNINENILFEVSKKVFM